METRYWIRDSLSLELGFLIPIVSGIPDSLSCIPDSKAQDSDSTSKKFPAYPIPQAESLGFRNPDSRLHGSNLVLSNVLRF